MDEWTLMLLAAEDAWREEKMISGNMRPIIRDKFKARFIYDTYGYENFLEFVERCPHFIKEILNDYVPCKDNNQCMLFCKFYKNGGCKNATK